LRERRVFTGATHIEVALQRELDALREARAL
jgi:hypothetical protein